MNKKLIIVLLLVVFSVMCVMGLVACRENNDGDGEKKYTITWKNDNGDVLKVNENVKEGTLPVYDGATPTKKGTADTRYVFNGWSPSVAEVSGNATYTATYIVRNKEDLVLGVDAVFSQDNKTAQYGFYPQTYVGDENLIAELNKLTPTQTNGWYLYDGNYYAKQTARVYNNESYVFDDGTAIINGTEYWFKCEVIEWKVLSSANGTYRLLSSKLLDARNYYKDYTNRTIDGATVYANDYVQSDIRAWLNDDFYNTAFALGNANIQEVAVGSGAKDKICLPSYNDYLNADYGFNANADETSETRECKTTDYARATGAWCNSDKNGSYWTSTPSDEYYYCAWNVNSGGYLSEYAVDGSSHCVRPCINVVF